MEFKEPTRTQWDKAVEDAANMAIMELRDACFIADALAELFLPEYPEAVADALLRDEWWELERRLSNEPASVQFKCDVAKVVAKRLSKALR